MIKGSTDERPCFEISLSNRRSSDKKELPNHSKPHSKATLLLEHSGSRIVVEALLWNAVAAEHCIRTCYTRYPHLHPVGPQRLYTLQTFRDSPDLDLYTDDRSKVCSFAFVRISHNDNNADFSLANHGCLP
jgi:hypothetical protein